MKAASSGPLNNPGESVEIETSWAPNQLVAAIIVVVVGLVELVNGVAVGAHVLAVAVDRQMAAEHQADADRHPRRARQSADLYVRTSARDVVKMIR